MKSAAVLLALSLLLPAASRAQDAAFIRSHYTKREVRIAMRDGVRLFTSIYLPRDTTERHPIVLKRTPYDVAPYGDSVTPLVDNQVRAYLRENYIVVYQDQRGRYMSEGTYEDVRPILTTRRSARDADETTDSWDTVEWLVHNLPYNNGRVGIRGTSNPGGLAAMGAMSGHPAIRVVSPQAPVTEWMGGDDWFHHGAFLLSHAFDFYYGYSFGFPRPQPKSEEDALREHGTADGYEFFLRLGALSNVNARYMHDSVAFWNQITQHGTWDDFWAARSLRPHLVNLRPAMLWVGGWFDTENLWGALNAYAAAERQNPGLTNRLVMGPWYHGGWNGSPGDSLGIIGFASATSQFFTDSIELPFFNYYLKDGQPRPRDFEAAAFETGTNVWRFFDTWPPRAVTPTNLFLQAGGGLSFAPPAAAGQGYDEYTNDPARPVPYTAETTHWYDPAFMIEDQRFASKRPDVLVYQTEPLTQDLTIAGPIAVDFSVSTSGTDADWVVKLIDVFPSDSLTEGHGFQYAAPTIRQRLGGYQMLVRGDVLRGKFRNSLSAPEPFVPDDVTPIRFGLNDAFHTFKAGHRIMVQVQSSWFPMIDRNPGRFMDIFRATDADFQRTTQRLYRSRDLPSHLVVQVLGR